MVYKVQHLWQIYIHTVCEKDGAKTKKG